MTIEDTPLIDDVSTAYGSASHVTVTKPSKSEEECYTDYEPLKLSTFRVFCAKRGSVIENPVLFFEQILTTMIFAGCAIVVYVYFKEDVTDTKKAISIRRFLEKQESKMRAFAMIMTGLAAFLLSFYTAIVVGRWWTMRSVGVGGIKRATVDLHLLIHQCVTKEEQVLSAVRRYGRASLILIFMWRRKQIGDLKDYMLKYELLTEDECDRLAKCGHCLHETIWAWQTAIVESLQKQGKIKSDEVFKILLERCTEGRAAVQCVHTHLAVRVPMMYVHLLGLLVKMHNVVLAIIMGLLFGAALRNGLAILCVQLFARSQILPFLFNAILLINCDLADPFNGGDVDFPGLIYQETLDKDCRGFENMAKEAPDWFADSPA